MHRGYGMTLRQHQQPGAVHQEWRRSLHWDDRKCICGRLRNDHYVGPGGEHCGDGYYYAPALTKRERKAGQTSIRNLVEPEYVSSSDSDSDKEDLRQQLAQQAEELRRLKDYKAAIEAKEAASKAKADAETNASTGIATASAALAKTDS